MRERSRLFACLVAVGIVWASTPTFAWEFQDYSRRDLSVGLEVNLINKGLDATSGVSGTTRLPLSGAFAADVENSIGKTKLTEVLVRVNYEFNENFIPYLLLGSSGLSFDDRYKINVQDLPSAEVAVHYSDAASIGYGLGAEGVLMELPAKMKLGYGVRFFTFKSSDDVAVAPEEINSLLAQLNPVEDVMFATGVSFTKWDISLGVSREYELEGSFSVTPRLGYRHSSVTVHAVTDVEFSPGMPNYVEAKFDRSLGGSLSSVTLGVTGTYAAFIGASLELAVGDETGISLAVTYGF